MRIIDSPSFLGAHAEAQFLTLALEYGWEVTAPFVRDVPYDFVIKRTHRGLWEMVQVKRAYYTKKRSGRGKILEVGLRRRGAGIKYQPYEDGDFDLLFAYHERGRWLIPWEILKERRSGVQVGSFKYNQWRV
jgi:hypothetical protein